MRLQKLTLQWGKITSCRGAMVKFLSSKEMQREVWRNATEADGGSWFVSDGG